MNGSNRYEPSGVGRAVQWFLSPQLPLITLAAILLICWQAASLGIRKIKSLEPAVVFRG